MNRNPAPAVRAAAEKRRSQKTCKRGHKLVGNNVYRPPKRPGSRYCVLCQKIRKRVWNKHNPHPLTKSPRHKKLDVDISAEEATVRRMVQLEQVKQTATGELADLIKDQEKDSKTYRVYKYSLDSRLDYEYV